LDRAFVALVDVDDRSFATMAAGFGPGLVGVGDEGNEDEEDFCKVGMVKVERGVFCIEEDMAESR